MLTFGLGRNEGEDPYSSPYIIRYSSFHCLSHSFIPNLRLGSSRAQEIFSVLEGFEFYRLEGLQFRGVRFQALRASSGLGQGQ